MQDVNNLILLLYLSVFIGDISFLGDLRTILRDILIGNRNRKSERKIYQSQDLRNKVSLSYIKPYLKYHIQAFERWHKVYKVYPLAMIQKYVVATVLTLINIWFGVNFLVCVFALQIVGQILMRILIFPDGFRASSKYAKRN